MAGSVFRKKSMDRVSSPEQLNDYIKVSNPAVWMVISAVVILLIGICVWGIFGKLDTVIKGGGYCQDGTVHCYLQEKDLARLTQDTKITIEGKEYPIASVAKMPIEIDEEDYESNETEPHLYAMHKSGLEEDDWACDVLVNAPLEDGVYDTSITVESVSPMSFILK